MKVIGDTIGGTLVVEMSRAEWSALNGDAVQREVANKTLDIGEWQRRFQAELRHLALSVRVRNIIRRCIAFSEIEIVELVFAANGRYLDFEEWVLAVHERKIELNCMRNIGIVGTREIMQAADRYLLDHAQEFITIVAATGEPA